MQNRKETEVTQIIEFHTQDELRASLKEWQNRLFLNDWIITARLVDISEMNDMKLGENHTERVHKSSVIRIAKLNDDMRSRVVKISHEQVLIHELLHCKYNWITGPGYENTYVDTEEHALLEQMARSLFMAKYNLGPEWFNNT